MRVIDISDWTSEKPHDEIRASRDRCAAILEPH
jgi:hypothetical protein